MTVPPAHRVPPNRDRRALYLMLGGTAAVVLLLLAAALLIARRADEKKAEEKANRPIVSVSLSPSPSPSPSPVARPRTVPADATDGDGMNQRLTRLIGAAAPRGVRCILARPGVAPPTDPLGAIVEERGTDFNPAEPKVYHVTAGQARDDAATGLVLIHRWCAA